MHEAKTVCAKQSGVAKERKENEDKLTNAALSGVKSRELDKAGLADNRFTGVKKS